jgi:hypothetical protein
MYVYRASHMKYSEIVKLCDLVNNNSKDVEKRFIVPGPMTACVHKQSAMKNVNIDGLQT